jgi:hypothetical protein
MLGYDRLERQTADSSVDVRLYQAEYVAEH